MELQTVYLYTAYVIISLKTAKKNATKLRMWTMLWNPSTASEGQNLLWKPKWALTSKSRSHQLREGLPSKTWTAYLPRKSHSCWKSQTTYHSQCLWWHHQKKCRWQHYADWRDAWRHCRWAVGRHQWKQPLPDESPSRKGPQCLGWKLWNHFQKANGIFVHDSQNDLISEKWYDSWYRIIHTSNFK